MNLLVGFYQDSDRARTDEFLECLRRNSTNACIDSITVFIEDTVSPEHLRCDLKAPVLVKLDFVPHRRRLRFDELFDYANQRFPGSGVIIANGDIWFDETLTALENESLSGRMLCLSRWDEDAAGALHHFDRPDSQDAWVFEPPLPKIAAEFFLGTPGCDNRLAYEAERAGLLVCNPSRSLRARHLHKSGVRRYSQQDRVFGPTRFVPASFLTNVSTTQKPVRPTASEFPSHRGRRKDLVVSARVSELEALLRPHLGTISRALRAELRRSLQSSVNDPPLPQNQPLATVAFRERMGLTVARIEPGISTHNNDARPITSIPQPLAGLSFTQAVSCRSTPVTVEFRSEGQLFVLAAPGWEGYAPAAAFLDDAGWRAPFEPLRTSQGTYFEVWHLIAKAGECLTFPVQVMLAGAELIPLR
jgi:hypothetical protein